MRCCCEKLPLLLNQEGVQVYIDMGIHVSIGAVPVNFCPYCGKQLSVHLDDKKGPEESLACLLGPFQFPTGYARSGM